MKVVRFIALLLVIIGALNWGLIGFFQYDLISDILGGMDSTVARVVYAIVGLAGLYCISLLCKSCCGCCSGSSCGSNCKCGCCNKQQR